MGFIDEIVAGRAGLGWALAAVAGLTAPAWAQPTLEEGGIFFIAQDETTGQQRLFFLTGGPGADMVVTPLNATFGPGEADLPAFIGVEPLDDRADVLVAVDGGVQGRQVFGLSGVESPGAWDTGGLTIWELGGFEDPLVGFDDPLVGAPAPLGPATREALVALHASGWVAFDEPIIEVNGDAVGFDDPLLGFGPDGLILLDRSDDDAGPVVIAGTSGYDVRGVVGFPPGGVSVATPADLPGRHAAIALLAGGDGFMPPTIFGVWGELEIGAGSAVSIWGTTGTLRPISEGGLLVEPVSLVAWPSGWQGLDDSFFVLDLGPGAARGAGGARIVGVSGDGAQRLVTEGGSLVAPTDVATLPSGELVVVDPVGPGGDGVIVLVDPATGAQTALASGGVGLGFAAPTAVGVAGCVKPTFVVDSTADSVDANPGDGIVADSLGRATLRAAVMEANASPCGAIIDLSAVSVTLAIPGAFEDGSTTGDLDIASEVSIFGAGRDVTRVSGNGLDRVFDVRPGGSLTLSDLEVSGGLVNGSSGGGIRSDGGSLVLTRVLVESNQSPGGAGGVSNRGGELVAVDTEVRFNTGDAGTGGLVSAFNVQQPTTLLARCLIRSNSTRGNAGGIRASSGTMDLVNVTISGNGADENGGGLVADGGAVVTLDHCTVASNQADADGDGGFFGGGIFQTFSTIRLRSTIVADNETDSIVPQNLSGAFESLGHNLLEETGMATVTGATGTDLVGVDPLLGPLAENGGPTRTHALAPSSPAIDAADPATTTTEDQRGVARPLDGDFDAVARPDVGAYEHIAPTCEADITGDGKTNIFDFAELADNFGEGPGATRGQGDLTGDGFVDVFDFADLADDFGCDVTP